MLSFTITQHGGISVLQLNGAAQGDEALHTLNAAFGLVRPDDHLVLELSETTELDARAASRVHQTLHARPAAPEVILVSPRDHISRQLSLHGVDHVSRIVRTMAEALDILAAQTGADEPNT